MSSTRDWPNSVKTATSLVQKVWIDVKHPVLQALRTTRSRMRIHSANDTTLSMFAVKMFIQLHILSIKHLKIEITQ